MGSIVNPCIPGGTYTVPHEITSKTLRHLQRHRTEAVCFWLGKVRETSSQIDELWIPEFEATAVSYDISPVEMLRLKEHLDIKDKLLLAQIHSHPGTAFHSETDNLNAASPWPGFISIVIPNLGSLPGPFFEQAQVYELSGGGRWNHLSAVEVRRRFAGSEAA